jgi:hypothetical protein
MLVQFPDTAVMRTYLAVFVSAMLNKRGTQGLEKQRKM